LNKGEIDLKLSNAYEKQNSQKLPNDNAKNFAIISRVSNYPVFAFGAEI
jgi:hypothetical protein